MGMESPKSAPQKADDSYRARSRWGHLFEPTGRWVFCCRPAKKSAEENDYLRAFLTTVPQARPERRRRGERLPPRSHTFDLPRTDVT
jgi:hypothetical protein